MEALQAAILNRETRREAAAHFAEVIKTAGAGESVPGVFSFVRHAVTLPEACPSMAAVLQTLLQRSLVGEAEVFELFAEILSNRYARSMPVQHRRDTLYLILSTLSTVSSQSDSEAEDDFATSLCDALNASSETDPECIRYFCDISLRMRNVEGVDEDLFALLSRYFPVTTRSGRSAEALKASLNAALVHLGRRDNLLPFLTQKVQAMPSSLDEVLDCIALYLKHELEVVPLLALLLQCFLAASQRDTAKARCTRLLQSLSQSSEEWNALLRETIPRFLTSPEQQSFVPLLVRHVALDAIFAQNIASLRLFSLPAWWFAVGSCAEHLTVSDELLREALANPNTDAATLIRLFMRVANHPLASEFLQKLDSLDTPLDLIEQAFAHFGPVRCEFKPKSCSGLWMAKHCDACLARALACGADKASLALIRQDERLACEAILEARDVSDDLNRCVAAFFPHFNDQVAVYNQCRHVTHLLLVHASPETLASVQYEAITPEAKASVANKLGIVDSLSEPDVLKALLVRKDPRVFGLVRYSPDLFSVPPYFTPTFTVLDDHQTWFLQECIRRGLFELFGDLVAFASDDAVANVSELIRECPSASGVLRLGEPLDDESVLWAVLERDVQSPHSRQRHDALCLLDASFSREKWPVAIRLLRPLLVDPKRPVRQAAAQALATWTRNMQQSSSTSMEE